jgi:hypothetical protein
MTDDERAAFFEGYMTGLLHMAEAHDPLLALVASFVAANEWQASTPAECVAAKLLDETVWTTLDGIRRVFEHGDEQALVLAELERIAVAR